MQLIGVTRMPFSVSAVAVRETQGSVEVAMVLDNTWSMSMSDSSGVKKIDALKSAATNLTTKLKTSGKDQVKIGLVPYADYVNVGTNNRTRSWVSVPADYSTTSQQTCTTKTTAAAMHPGHARDLHANPRRPSPRPTTARRPLAPRSPSRPISPAAAAAPRTTNGTAASARARAGPCGSRTTSRPLPIRVSSPRARTA